MPRHNTDSRPLATRPFLITFSGIDGAGKTTQIEYVSARLREQGLRVVRLSFWDDVAAWSKLRSAVGDRSVDHDARKAERSFVPRNNKHIRKWYLTAARSGFYALDVARLRLLLASRQVEDADVIIFDRYIYDQVANIYSQSVASRIYGKALLSKTPVPDLAFVLDTSPAAAFARKPEYPLDFMHLNRQNFLRLGQLVPRLIIVPEASPEAVSREIFGHISTALSAPVPSREEKTETTLGKGSSPATELL